MRIEISKTLACVVMLLTIATSVSAAYVIPGVQRNLSSEEYELAWAFMGTYALNNCYEGPSRSVSRSEVQAYAKVFTDIKDEILRREPGIDSYLLFLDVARGSRHTLVERNPGGWICNYARLRVAKIYYRLFPARCSTADGCRL